MAARSVSAERAVGTVRWGLGESSGIESDPRARRQDGGKRAP